MADDSIFDKMIEMGMGMTMANQIPRMMNQIMPDQTPTTPPQMQGVALQVYAFIENKQVGPLSQDECIELVEMGKIVDNTPIWKPGLKSWLAASQIPEIGKLLLLYKP